MGFIMHSMLVAEVPSLMDARFGGHWEADRKKFEAELADFRASLPDDSWRALVVGPVESLTNGYAWLAFLPDGSKEGWNLSDEGDQHRARFHELFGGLLVRWGDDDPFATFEEELT